MAKKKFVHSRMKRQKNWFFKPQSRRQLLVWPITFVIEGFVAFIGEVCATTEMRLMRTLKQFSFMGMVEK